MARRLPPLKALQAFESAARHLSVAKAARELCVTSAAVSQQLKKLETYLGVELIRRRSRTLKLTEEGQAHLPELQDAFARLTDTWVQLNGAIDDVDLRVSVTSSFAERWIAPRLARFQEAYPSFNVRVNASLVPVDLTAGSFDIAICRGPGLTRPAGVQVEHLLSEQVFPVCSPGNMFRTMPMRVPDDLRAHTLLHIDGGEINQGYPDWGSWLRAAGVYHLDSRHGPRFNSFSVAIQAAINGQGVALGGSVLVEPEISNGQLTRPFAIAHPQLTTYNVVCLPTAARRRRGVAAFRNWLFDEAAPARRQQQTIARTVSSQRTESVGEAVS